MLPPPGDSGYIPITVIGPGGVSCDVGVIWPAGSTGCDNYLPGSSVMLVAEPDAGATFVLWSGCESTSGNTCTAIAGVSSVTAVFDWLPVTVHVVLSGAGAGTVTSSPDGISCGETCEETLPHGALLSLTATPAPHSSFAGWDSGACNAISPATCKLVLSGNTTVTARFDQDPPPVPPTVTTSTAPAPAPEPTPDPALTCATDRSLCPPGALQLAAATTPAAHGQATIELACDGPGSCDEHLVCTISIRRRIHGTITTKRVLAGRAHVVLAGGERQAVQVRLTRRARVLLAQRNRLRGMLTGSRRVWTLTLVRRR